jgi:transcriptional regulator with XRE-family HTH domain
MIPLTEAEHNKRVGEAIKHYRLNYKNPDKPKTRGLTQTELAKRIFVTFQQVQKYEKGTNGTSSYRILQIADALNIMVIDLFIYAYQDKADLSALFEQPMETIAELNIKEEKPLILKKDWIVNEKEEQN